MKKIFLLFTLCLFGLSAVWAQQTVTGTVTDPDGISLPGASVVVEGTTTGTVTDIDGNYSLNVPSGATALVYSFAGMLAQTVPINGRSAIDVTLQATVLEEVVVTALGVKREEKALGYSVQKVTGDDINKVNESNLVNSLTGKIAGIQVTGSSGSVGSSSRIIVRGASTIFGDMQPLFVIDGVPVSNANNGTAGGSGGFDLPNAAADLNPSDIESVTVLKGPTASALYGIRASNGVVVIITKKGTSTKTLGIEINSAVTFERPLIIPDYQNSYGQGNNPNYFEYIDGTSGEDGVDESWGPPLDVGLNFLQFTSFINNPDNPQPEPWVSYPDNIKDFYDTGVTIANNVSLSGGDDKTTFRLSMGYSDVKGIIPSTDMKKFTVTGAGSRQITEKFDAKFSINYIKSNSDNIPFGGYDGANVVQQTIWAGRQVDLQALKNWEELPVALPGSTFGEGIVPINWNTRFQNNPYWQLDINRNEFDRQRFIGSVGLSYQLSEMFDIVGNMGADYYVTKTNTRLAKGSAADAPTSALYGGNRIGSDGYYDEQETGFFESNIDLLLNFNKQINEDLKLSLSIGGSRMNRKTTFDFRAIQLELPDLYNLGNVMSGTSLFNRNRHAESSINSILGFGELSYKEYLFLSFTGRNDWASVLPIKNNSFFYPSVTVSALLTDIFDFKSDLISFMKIRGGWSKVGGFGPLDASDILPSYELSSLPWDGNTFASFPTTLWNPNLESQETTGLEGGLELRMFNGRLRLNATAYQQTSRNLVIPVSVSRASGVSQVWDNVGELENTGFEIQLGTTVFENQEKDFSVILDFNFATNNNEVIKAGKDDENNAETLILGGQWNMNLEAREGYPYGVIVGPSLERHNGQVVYEDGRPSVGETVVLGDIQPDWTGGVNLSVNYKGISLSTLVDAKIGGDVYSMTNSWGRFAGILEETLLGRETGVIGEGVKLDASGNYVPNDVVRTAEEFNKDMFDNGLVESSVFDASYVKLRQISLGYNLPGSLVSKIGLNNINISLIAKNLAILYKKAPHIDPETGFSNINAEQGQEFGQLPSTRSIGFNVNIKF